MKRILIVVVLIVAAAVLGLWRSNGGIRQGLSRAVGATEEVATAAPLSDETRKSFELKPGARIQVQGINGRVDIETADTHTAEVLVRRIGKDSGSLKRRELIIEQTSDGLLVRSKQNHVGIWDHLFGKDPREEVTIKAPRKIALFIKGLNGRLSSGDIDGSLEVKGVNGRVDLGYVGEAAQISGVNGSISIGLSKLGASGAQISGVNGGIELRLGTGLNADLTARGMNGNVRSEIADVTVNREGNRSRYSATIGTGGAPIDISGINGNVRLTRTQASTAAADAPTKQSNPASLESEKISSKVKGVKSTD